jgi:hypothetical protein
MNVNVIINLMINDTSLQTIMEILVFKDYLILPAPVLPLKNFIMTMSSINATAIMPIPVTEPERTSLARLKSGFILLMTKKTAIAINATIIRKLNTFFPAISVKEESGF